MEDMSGSEEDEDLSESGSEDEDEQASKSARPYMALLQGFNEVPERNAKRRKLDSGDAAMEVAVPHIQQPAESEADDEKDLDHVEEAEEDAAAAHEGEEADSDDDEDEADATDPFDRHFTLPDEGETSKRIKAIKNNQWSTKRTITKVSKALVLSPGAGAEADVSIPSPIKGPTDLKLKHKLQEVAQKKMASLTEFERAMAPMLFGYHDIMYGERGVHNADALRQLVCLHAINHVLKYANRLCRLRTFANRHAGLETVSSRTTTRHPKMRVPMQTTETKASRVPRYCFFCRLGTLRPRWSARSKRSSSLTRRRTGNGSRTPT